MGAALAGRGAHVYIENMNACHFRLQRPPARTNLACMDKPRPPIPFASAPLPIRLALGFTLLGLCLWLPAFAALFR